MEDETAWISAMVTSQAANSSSPPCRLSKRGRQARSWMEEGGMLKAGRFEKAFLRLLLWSACRRELNMLKNSGIPPTTSHFNSNAFKTFSIEGANISLPLHITGCLPIQSGSSLMTQMFRLVKVTSRCGSR